MPDFTLQDNFTIFILTANTKAARCWADEHLPADRMTWGKNGTVVEHRYIDPIVDGIIRDGLTVE